jgi:hypothetical protein
MKPKSDHSLWIVGTEGELQCPSPYIPSSAKKLVIIRKKKKTKEPIKSKTSFEYQLEALLNAITQNTPMITSIEDGIVNMQLIDEIYQKAGLKPRESTKIE